jgi:protein SCO1/2|tara:strand:- start:64 stop:744 length:681 start_codon:yes stop_codon:yes gene_type:complete
MNFRFFKKSLPLTIIMLVFSVFMISAIYSILKPEKRLPVFNPVDVNPRLVDQSLLHISSNHKIRDFSLINQNGKVITQEDYKDKIYVSDFFFTTCQTICPIMTHNMAKIQKEFNEDDSVMLLSHSVTPEIDSVTVLRDYADRKGVVDVKWNVTTGDKKHIYELARKSYFAVVDEGDGGVQDFIHTENFILVDKKRQIRGYYDGTQDEEMDRLITDIKTLQKEYLKN